MKIQIGITTDLEETRHFWFKSLYNISNFNVLGPFKREAAEEVKLKKIVEMNASPITTTMYSSHLEYKWWVYIIEVKES